MTTNFPPSQYSCLIVILIFLVLAKIGISILGQWSVRKGVSGEIVLGQGIYFDLFHLAGDEVLESPVLLPVLAFQPVLDLGEAHPGRHLLLLDAVRHALGESVAGMGLHRY